MYTCLWPYHVENTSSRPIIEVKQRRARLIIGWVTAWENTEVKQRRARLVLGWVTDWEYIAWSQGRMLGASMLLALCKAPVSLVTRPYVGYINAFGPCLYIHATVAA